MWYYIILGLLAAALIAFLVMRMGKGD